MNRNWKYSESNKRKSLRLGRGIRWISTISASPGGLMLFINTRSWASVWLKFKNQLVPITWLLDLSSATFGSSKDESTVFSNAFQNSQFWIKGMCQDHRCAAIMYRSTRWFINPKGFKKKNAIRLKVEFKLWETQVYDWYAWMLTLSYKFPIKLWRKSIQLITWRLMIVNYSN